MDVLPDIEADVFLYSGLKHFRHKRWRTLFAVSTSLTFFSHIVVDLFARRLFPIDHLCLCGRHSRSLLWFGLAQLSCKWVESFRRRRRRRQFRYNAHRPIWLQRICYSTAPEAFLSQYSLQVGATNEQFEQIV
jgi:hypothetical protein